MRPANQDTVATEKIVSYLQVLNELEGLMERINTSHKTEQEKRNHGDEVDCGRNE